jgi:putative mycofactocin binding protein MftB
VLLELDPRVALRPEPFGALAYHHGTRRLTFLRSAELVAVVESLREHASVEDALEATGVHRRRWPSFLAAVDGLASSGFLRVRAGGS